MYRLYEKLKDRDLFLVPLVLLNMSKVLGHFFWRWTSGYGFPQSADSKWYLEYAYTLMHTGKIGLHMNDILYLGYNVLLTLLLAVFQDQIVVLFIQAVTAGLSIILVYRIGEMLFSRTTAIIASLFFFNLYDITLWSTYILSESFFISLLLLCIYFLLRALETNSVRYRVLFILSSVYLTLFRPTGILLAVSILTYIFLQLDKFVLKEFVKKYKLQIGGLSVVGLIVIAHLLSRNALNPLIQSFEFNVKLVLYNVYAKGWIYDMPTAYDHFFRPDYRIDVFDSLTLSFIINNWQHVLILYGKRTIAFLGKWVWEVDLSSMTGIMLFISNAMPTFLFITGTMAAAMNRVFRKASIIWLITFAIYLFCTVLFIDWMYRYRSPATPFVAIISAYGAEVILLRTLAIVKKYAGVI